MGTKPRRFTPVSAISLEALVPADHFYRDLDRVLDLGVVRDLVRDVYVCPAGKDLCYDRPHSTDRSRRYRARAKDCNHCPLKAQCTTSRQGRTLCRSV